MQMGAPTIAMGQVGQPMGYAPQMAMTGGYQQQMIQGQQTIQGQQMMQGAVVGQQVYETIVPEVVQTTGTKYLEVPEMVVRKQMVPEIIEQVVERRVQNIIQEVERRVNVPQMQTVERIVEVPQYQSF